MNAVLLIFAGFAVIGATVAIIALIDVLRIERGLKRRINK